MHCVFSIEIPNVFVEKVEDEQSHKGLKKITEYARLIIIVCAKQAFPSNKTHKKKGNGENDMITKLKLKTFLS